MTDKKNKYFTTKNIILSILSLILTVYYHSYIEIVLPINLLAYSISIALSIMSVLYINRIWKKININITKTEHILYIFFEILILIGGIYSIFIYKKTGNLSPLIGIISILFIVLIIYIVHKWNKTSKNTKNKIKKYFTIISIIVGITLFIIIGKLLLDLFQGYPVEVATLWLLIITLSAMFINFFITYGDNKITGMDIMKQDIHLMQQDMPSIKLPSIKQDMPSIKH